MDHQLLASRYLDMHGTAGVRRKIAQLQTRKRLTATEQGQLAALKALLPAN